MHDALQVVLVCSDVGELQVSSGARGPPVAATAGKFFVPLPFRGKKTLESFGLQMSGRKHLGIHRLPWSSRQSGELDKKGIHIPYLEQTKCFLIQALVQEEFQTDSSKKSLAKMSSSSFFQPSSFTWITFKLPSSATKTESKCNINRFLLRKQTTPREMLFDVLTAGVL